MPKLRTKYVYVGAGVYICRRGDAVHIVVTTDSQPPDQGKVDKADGLGGSSEALAKANWQADQEVSVEQFNDVVATVAPEWKGQLVNVGTEDLPLLLTQQQAAVHAGLIDRQVKEAVVASTETAIPVAPAR